MIEGAEGRRPIRPPGWGNNWPVVKLAGTLAEEVKVAEAYLADKTPAQRDKVMLGNAVLFYRRIPSE